MVELTAKNLPEGKTLKSYILDIYPFLRQSVIKRALLKGDIRINDGRVRKNIVLMEGDVINIYIPEEELGFTPSLELVYEDENIMIINKFPGISSFDDRNDGSLNIMQLAAEHMKEKGEYDINILNVPYLCHRLDHFTGGLLLIAKNEQSSEFIHKAFRERRIRKFYQAIVCGTPEPKEAQLHDFLLKDPVFSRVKIYENQIPNTVPIVTRYRTISSIVDLSRLEIELVTGRTHQIRAHMAFYGYPVLGDDKYGGRQMNKKYNADYQALWATRLVFDTGGGHFMEYLNKKVFETINISFPDSVIELGL